MTAMDDFIAMQNYGCQTAKELLVDIPLHPLVEFAEDFVSIGSIKST